MRFQDLRIRSKLALTFCLLLLPLLGGGMVAQHRLSVDLRTSAELELSNIVTHLYQLCQQSAAGGAARPSPEAKELIRSFRVGRSGYAYAMDSAGNLQVHPEREGENILDSRDSEGFAFIQAISEQARQLQPGQLGTIRYPWASGGEPPRVKILKFAYLPEWDWILAAGSYEEEIYSSLERIEHYLALVALASLLLVAALTLAMNRLITRPLDQISQMAAQMAAGDLRSRVPWDAADEFGALARALNAMADEVRDKTENLEKKVWVHTEALRESMEKYRRLVESTVDGIVTTDVHGSVTFVNKGFERIVGTPRSEVIGKRIWQFYPDGKEQARNVMSALSRSGAIGSFEMELLGVEHRIPIRTSATILRDASGEIVGTLGIFADLTKQRKLEADLKRAQADLVQTMKLRALGDLVSGVAHEVNNPLMASTTILHVMDRSTCKDDCPNKSRIGVLQRCNTRIARIVDHLREFSRQSEMRREPLEVNRPIRNALVITGQQLLNMQIEIQQDLEEDLPAVLGDANHLEQVFLDIIANARDAMEGLERRQLHIRSARCEQGVEIVISDTGPGIPAEVRDKIFEPFFTTKEAGKGTGLGLSICYGIIEEHGGIIEATRNRQGGTSIRIVLPTIEVLSTEEIARETGQDSAHDSEAP